MRSLARIAVLLCVCAGPADAADFLYAVKLGALAHDVPDLWSGFQIERDAIDINVEAQFAAAWALPWGAIRPVIGGTINTRGDTSHAYIDARWQGDCLSGLFFGIGLGAAVHDGEIGGINSDPDKNGWARAFFFIFQPRSDIISMSTTTCRSILSTPRMPTRKNITRAWTASASVTAIGSRLRVTSRPRHRPGRGLLEASQQTPIS